MKNSLCFLLLTLLPAAAQAQKAPAAAPRPAPAAPVFASPAGVYAIVSNATLSPAHPRPDGARAVRLLRAPAGTTDFKEVSRVEQASSLNEFRQQAGQATLDELKQTKKLPTDEAVWTYIQAHPALSDYGLMPLNMAFRVAMGTACLDASAATVPAGTRFTYRLEPDFARGQGLSRADAKLARYPEATIVTGQRSALPRPRAARPTGSDSVVVVRWVAAPARSGPNVLPTLFGRVWRQAPGERAFAVVADQIFAARTPTGGDSVRFTFEQRVQPEAMYRYYVEPLDFVSNPGPASDTTTVFSVSVNRMPIVTRLAAKDTTDGIVLRWPALPAKAYLLGIEIQRSRDTRGSYVRLDTIPATANHYLDAHLLPNVTYHYRLRAILSSGLKAPEATTAAAFAAHQGGEGRSPNPLAPVQFTAQPEKRGIRLRWQPQAPDLNHDAYFVYRSLSVEGPFEIVSPALSGNTLTFLDTTARNGRRQYVYAVKDVNRNRQQSLFSDLAFAQPNRPMPVTAPAGLQAYANGTTLHLTWEDARRRDPAIVGYRLYRRPAAAISAGKTGFARLGPPDLLAAAYEDHLPDNRPYQYAVAAIDALGTESAWSPVAAGQAPVPVLLPPSQLNARPLPTGLELNWSQPAQAPPKGYALYRRVREQTEAQRLATLTPAQTTYLDLTAKPGTLYIYSLAALGPTQESERTPEISARR